MNKKALGRGLHTLLPGRSPGTGTAAAFEPPVAPDAALSELPIDAIVPNPFQPRKHFDEHALEELAQSIRTDGMIQPLVVRRAGSRYELIAGERRWRASRLAGLAKVPVHVQELADDRMLEVALVENIQREDLNPMESSRAFHRLSEDLGLSHEEIGQRTGKDRATISNAIRLLQLPDDIQGLVEVGKLSPGHARALMKIQDSGDMRRLAEQSIELGWSVRELERVSAGARKSDAQPPAPVEKAQDPNVKAAVDDMERALGTRVRVIEKLRGKGRIEIEYYSQDDLNRIYSAIIGQ
jgi:ParB family chromosome partitioning protein